PSPFDPHGVRNVFRERPFPVGQALRHLQVLLDLRLSEYEGDEPWPTDDLRIHERWLELKMWQGERWYGTGGFRG
ncbi:hypothetical protein, partial [Nonomuraea basaltis]|uniref:hypothetical protein n=1 Tax=Nonomuraea basaltis TaxID=2495887 RepID=UPI001486351C